MSCRPVSAIWKNNLSTLTESFDLWWDDFIANIPHNGCDVFFRADDIGYPGKQFSAMINIFKEHKTPLALAVAPSWLNEQRRDILLEELGPDLNLWALHQHGYRHMNHEQTGKKFEFGPSRDKKVITGELGRGKAKLSKMLGDNFSPIFTPPWNRCSADTMESLVELGFSAISRSTNVYPNPPQKLPDIPVNVDLHTIKESSPEQGIKTLQSLMEEAVKSGCAGFMLHHQRMNKTSQLFLHYLLGKINITPGLRVKDIRELL
ncbi:polysaccharide deacetylase family protein [Maridesulfovibrio salexigens]|uniref:Polysaccharide deacetylase n=1 Tax=Maridesulfovibrio salexigens (strain ATCC 14822 / DSM 2638 / NCIMB 8403 / VKM B-1763) TaxID=526222 RepID=C6BTP3_MARSD|nr:polysaccharide deacetylase family protein [Maridesulfovibrio salexigens]ACS79823.1 polysaccharide deacetylase [Maridesulfovibrio salexigens DSM 2638]